MYGCLVTFSLITFFTLPPNQAAKQGEARLNGQGLGGGTPVSGSLI